jgi:hypothetical protein
MIVRIRLQRGPRVKKNRRKNQHVALALATLLNPAAVTACALALWRLAADLGTARQFAIPNGLFSHWQVWLGIMALLKLAAILLNRYGNSEPVLQNSEQKTRETLLNSGF